MKKNLQKKLYTLLTLCAIGLIFCLPSKAQIIYTDVIPDSIFSTNGGTFFLDLNNDGIMDFKIIHSSSVSVNHGCVGSHSNQYVRITPLDSNMVSDTVYSTNHFPNMIMLNAVINDSLQSWRTDSNQVLGSKIWGCLSIGGPATWHTTNSGKWLGSVDRFVGLKLIANGNTYYGWLRMDVNSSALSFTIKDYAYNAVSGQPILAGSIVSGAGGIQENINQLNFNVYPNPFAFSTTVSFVLQKPETVSLKIFDISGRLIDFPANIKFPAGENRFEWMTGDLKCGIYFLRIQTKDLIETKKLVVAK